jgi:hypothetical protein
MRMNSLKRGPLYENHEAGKEGENIAHKLIVFRTRQAVASTNRGGPA